jgi:hypothetical protein
MNNIESLLVEIRDLLTEMIKQRESRKRESKAEADDLYTLGFEAAWSGYPRKIGKRMAAKAYRSALTRIKTTRPELPMPERFILKGILAYAKVWPESRILEEAKYCLHMATFLNQDRFDDDPDAWGKEESSGEFGGPAWEPTVD